MRLENFIQMLDIMSKHQTPATAVSVNEIARKWDRIAPGNDPDVSTLRQVRRYVVVLSDELLGLPALLLKVEKSDATDEKSHTTSAPKAKGKKITLWYLPKAHIVRWFMSEEAALNVLLTGRLIVDALGRVDQLKTAETTALAKNVINQKSSSFQKIADHLRLLPDGIGRLPANIEEGLLQKVIDAIASDRAVSFDYQPPQKNKARRIVNPLGLVGKDGSIYLVASKGFDTQTITYATHRASNAHVESQHPRYVPENFDLDQFIENAQQFSHRTGDDIDLVLEVEAVTLYHFEERPLSNQQTISPSQETDGWFTVQARIPQTHMLVPFLLSMMGHIKVVAPATVREEMIKQVTRMNAHYA